MSGSNKGFVDSALVSKMRKVVAVCDQFEADWRSGRNPSIEQYLPDPSDPERAVLEKELLALEATLAQESGAGDSKSSSASLSATLLDPASGPRSSVASDDTLPIETQASEVGLHDDDGFVPTLPNIPDYVIELEIGRGGMGVVYKARQIHLNRICAIKMILAGEHASRDHATRFLAEAETIARLQHPNIVQVHHLGFHEGRPFVELEYVAGGSLAERIDGSPRPPHESAALLEPLAKAVQEAHRLGVVHRDLKPGNVLLSPDGTPKLADFGLAKSLKVSSQLTRSDWVLGSPSYMSPEQAAGHSSEAGPAADIYGLGAILYAMLTGRPPFKGLTAIETLELVRTADPVPPSKLRPGVPRDLETICLKCLCKEPKDRYEDAEALAEDLQAFLDGRPIQARRPHLPAYLALWIRRKPAVAALVGAGLVGALGLAVGIWSHSPLAVAGAGMLGILLACWFYGARVRSGLREVARQRLAAERLAARLHLLLQMTHRMVEAADLDELLRLICEVAVRLADADRASIFLLDPKRQELRSRVAMGQGVGVIRVPVGVGLAGAVAASGKPINTPDPYADPRFNPEVDRKTGYTTRNMLTLPLAVRQGGAPIGVFQVLNKRGGPFDTEDEEILTALARSAAVALENIRRKAFAELEVDQDPTSAATSDMAAGTPSRTEADLEAEAEAKTELLANEETKADPPTGSGESTQVCQSLDEGEDTVAESSK
jgi:tRNA A-37 threonylcarbamoyl transferase component Bud32/putative methionine-R-sulfoxide reductase with GAF domain